MLGLARAAGQARGLQETHGLERFTWFSSYGSDFNYDFHVSFTKEELAKGKVDYNYGKAEELQKGELPGLSVFYKDENGNVFHTYSTYARGNEAARSAPSSIST